MSRPPQIFAVSPILDTPPPPGHRSALLEHAIRLTGARRARVCFVPTAVGDSRDSIDAVHAAFRGATHAELSHLQLFPQPNVADVRSFLLSQDLIWVGGGSVVNLLAVWRAHRLDEILRECWEHGVVLGGGSAGSICWHLAGVTDSFSDRLDPVTDGLGFLPFSNGVHHDLADQPRRARYLELVGSGVVPPGYATDDGVGLHYVGKELAEAVSTAPSAAAYWVEPGGAEQVLERRVDTRPIS